MSVCVVGVGEFTGSKRSLFGHPGRRRELGAAVARSLVEHMRNDAAIHFFGQQKHISICIFRAPRSFELHGVVIQNVSVVKRNQFARNRVADPGLQRRRELAVEGSTVEVTVSDLGVTGKVQRAMQQISRIHPLRSHSREV